MHPAVLVDRLGGLLRLVPVAEHHRVATGAVLAGLPARDGLAGRRVDDLDLDVRAHPADRLGAPLQVVVATGLAADRAGLGHPVGDRHLAHVHLVDAAAHHLHRADRAGHDPGAQAAQVVLGEALVVLHGDEHRRHPVDPGAPLGRDGAQRDLRVEGGRRDDHRRPVGGAAEVGHDHAEAVVEGHRDAQPVLGPERDELGDEETVVEDVPMAERRPLRPSGGAGGVLDVDRVVRAQPRLTLGQRPLGHVAALLDQRRPVVGVEVDHPLQGRGVRGGLLDHPAVVAALDARGGDQHPHPRLVDGEGELVRPVGRVDVHQDRAHLRGGVLGDRPLGTVRRPDPDPVPGGDAGGQQATGDLVDGGVQLGPAPPASGAHLDQRLPVAALGDRALEVGADRLLQQRRGALAACVGLHRPS